MDLQQPEAGLRGITSPGTPSCQVSRRLLRLHRQASFQAGLRRLRSLQRPTIHRTSAWSYDVDPATSLRLCRACPVDGSGASRGQLEPDSAVESVLLLFLP